MKKATFNVTIEICVEVEDDVSLEDAEKIALFNIEPIISSISSDLNNKMKDIEVEDYHVNSADFTS